MSPHHQELPDLPENLSIQDLVKTLPDLDNETIFKFVKDLALDPKGFIAKVGQDDANYFTTALLMEAESRSGDDGPNPVFTNLMRGIVDEPQTPIWSESAFSLGKQIHEKIEKELQEGSLGNYELSTDLQFGGHPNRKARRAEEARLKRLRKKL